MNICATLNAVYGRDTRSAQVMNIFLCVIWGGSIWLHDAELIVVDMPPILCAKHANIIYISAIAMLFSFLGFISSGKRHQVFKFFGLSVGTLLQAILANAYFSAYPPLKMILVIIILVLVWQLGALSYIIRCEGLDGKFKRRS